MNDECRMSNVELAEEGGFSATAHPYRWVFSRFSNCRDTVTTIGKRLDDDGCLDGINASIVASPMRQLARNSLISRRRTFPSNINRATFFSPNGAKYDSPGHRPGSRSHALFSPEGATYLPVANPRVRTPLQGSGSWGDFFLGRCPRLAWIGPLVLKNRNANMEGRTK